MLVKRLSLSTTLCVLALALAGPVFAGSAVVGSVAGSTNATLAGQTLLPNTTLFSGDSLQVKNGVAMVTVGTSSHVAFGHDTVASFQRDSNEVTVLLGQGSVSVFHAEDPMGVRVKVAGVSVVPVSGFKTLGEVATLNGAVVVTAQEGKLRVEGGGRVVDVTKGKTITVFPSASAPQGTGGNNNSGPTIQGPNWWQTATAILGGIGIYFLADAWEDLGEYPSSVGPSFSGATSAANAALSIANAAASAAAAANNALGCALNTLANEQNSSTYVPPYTPPLGQSCP